MIELILIVLIQNKYLKKKMMLLIFNVIIVKEELLGLDLLIIWRDVWVGVEGIIGNIRQNRITSSV